MFSRTATGFSTGSADVGTSDFAAIVGLGLEELAADLGAAPVETLLLEAAAGLAAWPSIPGAAFERTTAAEAGFVVELLAGVALAFDVVDPAGELGAEPEDSLGVAGAGLIAELVGGAGLGVCA